MRLCWSQLRAVGENISRNTNSESCLQTTGHKENLRFDTNANVVDVMVPCLRARVKDPFKKKWTKAAITRCEFPYSEKILLDK